MTPKRGVPLRVAILGVGRMGAWHARYARRAGGSVVAVVDPDSGASARFVRRYPGVALYADLEPMLVEQALDVIHICAPAGTHVQLATAVLQRGIAALVEKPLAVDHGGTVQLLNFAESHAALVCPVYQFAFQRGVMRARQWLAEHGGALRIEVTICSAGAQPGGHAAEASLLREILPHPISVLHALVPEEHANLASWRVQQQTSTDLVAGGAFGTIAASVYLSTQARPPRAEARILTSRGTLVVDLFHGHLRIASASRTLPARWEKIVLPIREGAGQVAATLANLTQRASQLEPAYPGLAELIRQVYAAVANDTPSPLSRLTCERIAAWCDHVAGCERGTR